MEGRVAQQELFGKHVKASVWLSQALTTLRSRLQLQALSQELCTEGGSVPRMLQPLGGTCLACRKVPWKAEDELEASTLGKSSQGHPVPPQRPTEDRR